MSLRAIRTVVIVVAVLALLPATWVFGEEGGEGMELYNKKCAMCHGKDGVAKTMAKGSADLNDPEWQKTSTVEAIVKITTEGKGKMPAYAEKLSADEIRAVATYVKTLK